MMKLWPALKKQLADVDPAAKARDQSTPGASVKPKPKPATKPKKKAAR